MTSKDINLCHHDGNTFAKDLEKGKVIVSTGFGLSGRPFGTLSQILDQ